MAAAPTTNNRMELTGAIQALTCLRETPGPLAIYTDSTYVIKGIREWIWGWRRRGWKTADGGDVVNRELWEQLWDLIVARGKGAIEWHYVRGRSGIPGNERVDEIDEYKRVGVTLRSGVRAWVYIDARRSVGFMMRCHCAESR